MKFLPKALSQHSSSFFVSICESLDKQSFCYYTGHDADSSAFKSFGEILPQIKLWISRF